MAEKQITRRTFLANSVKAGTALMAASVGINVGEIGRGSELTRGRCLIYFEDNFSLEEKRLIIDTVSKTRKTLRNLGFATANWSAGKTIRFARSNSGVTQPMRTSKKGEGILLASVDERTISHEYATFFMPKTTQGIVEGSAEMVAQKTLGSWALDLNYRDYQNKDWQRALWWSASRDPVMFEFPNWSKVTLAGQAALELESRKHGTWAYLGEKDRVFREQNEPLTTSPEKLKENLQRWVEEKWPGRWREFENHPILFVA
jgi:hypothetical protein